LIDSRSEELTVDTISNGAQPPMLPAIEPTPVLHEEQNNMHHQDPSVEHFESNGENHEIVEEAIQEHQIQNAPVLDEPVTAYSPMQEINPKDHPTPQNQVLDPTSELHKQENPVMSTPEEFENNTEAALMELTNEIKNLIQTLKDQNDTHHPPNDESCKDEDTLRRKQELNDLLQKTDNAPLKDECDEEVHSAENANIPPMGMTQEMPETYQEDVHKEQPDFHQDPSAFNPRDVDENMVEKEHEEIVPENIPPEIKEKMMNMVPVNQVSENIKGDDIPETYKDGEMMKSDEELAMVDKELNQSQEEGFNPEVMQELASANQENARMNPSEMNMMPEDETMKQVQMDPMVMQTPDETQNLMREPENQLIEPVMTQGEMQNEVPFNLQNNFSVPPKAKVQRKLARNNVKKQSPQNFAQNQMPTKNRQNPQSRKLNIQPQNQQLYQNPQYSYPVPQQYYQQAYLPQNQNMAPQYQNMVPQGQGQSRKLFLGQLGGKMANFWNTLTGRGANTVKPQPVKRKQSGAPKPTSTFENVKNVFGIAKNFIKSRINVPRANYVKPMMQTKRYISNRVQNQKKKLAQRISQNKKLIARQRAKELSAQRLSLKRAEKMRKTQARMNEKKTHIYSGKERRQNKYHRRQLHFSQKPNPALKHRYAPVKRYSKKGHNKIRI